MQVPTIQNLIVYHDEVNGSELGREILSFVDTNLMRFEIDKIIVNEMPYLDLPIFYNHAVIYGDYLNGEVGTIQLCDENEEELGRLTFNFSYVLEFSGKYFALTPIRV